MIIDVKEKYNEIEADIIANEKDIFNMYNYYTHKYRGDLLNDVNVGLFLNDNYRPTVQIFVRNKTGYIKSHVEFNREGTEIVNINELNYELNG